MTHLVHQYLTQSAQRYPDGIAVSCGEDSLTYVQLEHRTNAIARALKNAGVQRNSFVPLFVEKSVNAISSLLGISKADSAYVPLDTTSPRERILSILAATNAPLVLVDDRTELRFQELFGPAPTVATLNVDRVDGSDHQPLEHENVSIDVAYVLFTSGSTGVPKGVMISHQMIVDYIDWCVETYGIESQDRVANHAPLYFDNSTFDIFTTMCAGAQLHLVYAELNQVMPKLIPWLQQNRITVFFCVPSVLSILMRTGKVKRERLQELRHVIAAGEVLPPDVVRHWMTELPDAQFTNMYGPTEITVDCTYHVITEVPDERVRSIPIGKPRRNMEVSVLTAEGALSSESGAEGEIVVRGLSVSYGYLNDQERTAEAFIQNPAHGLYPDRLYRTGDLARIDERGEFVYVGRVDQQIKYLGNRIELGEIESVVRSIEGVLDAVVVFNDATKLDEKFIGTIVVLAAPMTVEEVSARLRAHLPGYMFPRKILEVPKLPMTPNGKSDRRAALELLVG